VLLTAPKEIYPQNRVTFSNTLCKSSCIFLCVVNKFFISQYIYWSFLFAFVWDPEFLKINTCPKQNLYSQTSTNPGWNHFCTFPHLQSCFQGTCNFLDRTGGKQTHRKNTPAPREATVIRKDVTCLIGDICPPAWWHTRGRRIHIYSYVLYVHIYGHFYFVCINIYIERERGRGTYININIYVHIQCVFANENIHNAELAQELTMSCSLSVPLLLFSPVLSSSLRPPQPFLRSLRPSIPSSSCSATPSRHMLNTNRRAGQMNATLFSSITIRQKLRLHTVNIK
jgi:hypothetical protein